MNSAVKRSIVIILIVAIAACAAFYAEKLIHKARGSVYPTEYSEYVEKYSLEYGVPKDVIYAVIKVESNFDPNAESSKGAMGLMQLTPSTFEWLCGKIDTEFSEQLITDPEINIHAGVWYLSYLYAEFAVWETAYAAYNAGQGTVRGWLEDTEISDRGHLINIPYPETANYVVKVKQAREMYIKLLESETNQ